MALKAKRLETMRQITKGSSVVYVLIEVETNKVLGTYQDESLAMLDSDEVFYQYGVDCEIKQFTLNALHLEHD